MGARLTVLCCMVSVANGLRSPLSTTGTYRQRTVLGSTLMEKPRIKKTSTLVEPRLKLPNLPSVDKDDSEKMTNERNVRKENFISEHRLLTFAEEVELAKDSRRISKWDSIREELREELKRNPTEKEWAKACNENDVTKFRLRRQACREAKAAFVSANLPLVYSVAKRYRWVKAMGYEDVLQEGIFGLNRAVERFDPDLGYRFSTYAVWWIRQAIAAAILNQSRVIRLPPRLQQQLANLDKARQELEANIGRAPTNAELAAELQIDNKKIAFLKNTQRSTASPVISFDLPRGASVKSNTKNIQTHTASGGSSSLSRAGGALAVADTYADHHACPLQTAESQEIKEHIRHLLHTVLNPTECRVLELRFGLEDGTPRSLADIASIIQATPNQIRNIKAKALNKLRQPHNGNHILKTLSSLDSSSTTNAVAKGDFF
mmetsp:Transcript_17491/g.22799  ORF Transcript_17491/g.22799 Transcript_17491/m.22799 type:complete len:433 (-) Transcript_17491:304-1602(-)